MSSPTMARTAGEEPAPHLQDYGHLQRLTAHYAQARLAGRSVINRATGRRIRFDWPQGLRGAAAPGTPPELLLALPVLPRLLADARSLGGGDDPRRRHDVRQIHGFAASAEVAGRPIALWLVAREDRNGALAFDGVGPQSPLTAPGEDGGELPDLPGARTRALRTVLARAAPVRRQDGGATPDDAEGDGDFEVSASPDHDAGAALEMSPGEADAERPGHPAIAPKPRVPLGDWEILPPGDERDAAQHGYSLEEWRALQRGEAWAPPEQSEPGYFARPGRDIAENGAQAFGGNYGLPPEVYRALGGDNAVLTRWIYQPLAKTADLLGNPKRGPAFVANTATDILAELAYSLGMVGSPERAKGELGALAAAAGVAAGALGPETPPSLRAGAADTADASADLGPTLGAPTSTAKAQLAPRGNSVAFVARLPPEAYRGSYYSHRKRTNDILSREMEADPEFATTMNDLGIEPPRTSTGVASGAPIKGWTWHHEEIPGELHLVPAKQHRWTSPHWRVLHPNLPWGYRIWGKP